MGDICELERLLTDRSTDSQKKLNDLKKKLDLLAENAEKLSSWVHSVVPHMIKRLSSLDCNESDLKKDLLDCTAMLKDEQTLATYFINRLEDFFTLAASDKNKIQKIKYSVEKGEVRIFKNYISQLRMVMENCRIRYTEFEKKTKILRIFVSRYQIRLKLKYPPHIIERLGVEQLLQEWQLQQVL